LLNVNEWSSRLELALQQHQDLADGIANRNILTTRASLSMQKKGDEASSTRRGKLVVCHVGRVDEDGEGRLREGLLRSHESGSYLKKFCRSGGTDVGLGLSPNATSDDLFCFGILLRAEEGVLRVQSESLRLMRVRRES